MRYVILPQAMSTSVPAFVANVIFLLKVKRLPPRGKLSAAPTADG